MVVDFAADLLACLSLRLLLLRFLPLLLRGESFSSVAGLQRLSGEATGLAFFLVSFALHVRDY